MSKKTKYYIVLMGIIVILLIISAYVWDNNVLVLFKDILLAGTLSFSLIKTLNIDATFNKYKTTIKEINIYNYLNQSENNSINEMDKKIFDKVHNVYSKLFYFFTHRDISFVIPNDLFSDLMLMLDYDARQPDFKFSKINTDRVLSNLVTVSNEFILY